MNKEARLFQLVILVKLAKTVKLNKMHKVADNWSDSQKEDYNPTNLDNYFTKQRLIF